MSNYLFAILILFLNFSARADEVRQCVKIYHMTDQLCVIGVSDSWDIRIKLGNNFVLGIEDKYQKLKITELDHTSRLFAANAKTTWGMGVNEVQLILFRIVANHTVELIRSEPFEWYFLDAGVELSFSYESKFGGKCPDGIILTTKFRRGDAVVGAINRCLRTEVTKAKISGNKMIDKFESLRMQCVTKNYHQTSTPVILESAKTLCDGIGDAWGMQLGARSGR